MTLRFVVVSLALLRASSVRLGDDLKSFVRSGGESDDIFSDEVLSDGADASEPSSKRVVIGDGADASKPKQRGAKFADVIVKWFGDTKTYPEGRPSISEAQEAGDDVGKEGVAGKFDYLNTTCLKERAQYAATQFAALGGCTRLLEVGGYLTPFPLASSGDPGKALAGKAGKAIPPPPTDVPWDKNMQLYLNVDPTVPQTKKDNLNPKYTSVQIQTTLAEFMEAMDKAKPLQKTKKPFDCFIFLGIWPTFAAGPNRREALKKAIKDARVVIIESSQSVPDGTKLSTPEIESAGFKDVGRHTVDCSEDEEALRRNNNDPALKEKTLKRDIVVFAKGVELPTTTSTEEETTTTSEEETTTTPEGKGA